MITRIRKFIDSTAAKVLVLLIVAAVGGLFTLPLMFKKGSGGPWVAKVNGAAPSYSSFLKKVMNNEQRIRDFRSQYGQIADVLMQSMGMSLNPQVLAANQLIQEELLNQLSDKLDLHLDDEYVAGMLADPNFVLGDLAQLVPPALYDFEYGGINMGKLKQYLRRFGLTVSDFEYEINQMLKRSLVLNLALGASYEPKSMARSNYIQKYIPRDFSVLKFDFGKFLDDVKSEKISKKDLKTFFDKQNDEQKLYFVPEKRTGVLWEFDAASYGVGLDEDEIQKYYDDNKQKKYVEAPVKLEVRKIVFAVTSEQDQNVTLKKTQELHDQLVADSSLFEKKAKEFSEDKETAENGGLLPVFSRGTYDREFEKAAFLLKNDGDISGVVKTKDGYAIVQRVRRISALVKPLSAVRTEIKSNLLSRKFKNQFYKDMKRFVRGNISDDVQNKILSKKRNKVSVEPTEKSDSKLARALFKTKEDGFSFYTDGQKGFVVQTKEIQKRFLPALQAVKDVVEGDIYEERATHALSKAMDAAQKKAKTVSLSHLKDEFGVTLETTGMIEPDNMKRIKKLKERGIPVDHMMMLEKTGSVGSALGGMDGYVFQIAGIELFNQEDFDQKEAEIRSELKTEVSQLVIAALVAFLHRTAKIEVNKTVVNIGE